MRLWYRSIAIALCFQTPRKWRLFSASRRFALHSSTSASKNSWLFGWSKFSALYTRDMDFSKRLKCLEAGWF